MTLNGRSKEKGNRQAIRTRRESGRKCECLGVNIKSPKERKEDNGPWSAHATEQGGMGHGTETTQFMRGEKWKSVTCRAQREPQRRKTKKRGRGRKWYPGINREANTGESAGTEDRGKKEKSGQRGKINL